MNSDTIADFERQLLADIPLARAMQLRVGVSDADQLTLAAPLEPNRNDKGCVFGGSLVSVMTLAAWGLIVLQLRAAGLDCDVYVQDSQIRYLAPVWADFSAQARLAEGESWDDFAAALTTRGKARVHVDCSVAQTSGADACSLHARFVAITRS